MKLSQWRNRLPALLEVIGLAGKSSKPYCKLGKLIDAFSRERDIRGPYNIARYIKSRTGYKVSGVAVSDYLYGEYHPKQAFTAAFAEAFELNHQERSQLAWVYAYDSLDDYSTT